MLAFEIVQIKPLADGLRMADLAEIIDAMMPQPGKRGLVKLRQLVRRKF